MPKRRGRKKGRLYSEVKTNIHGVVKKYPGATTNEVALKAKVGWPTADKYLRALRHENKVKSRKVGNRTIWVV